MWIIDVETLRFLRVNRAACALYKYSETEFLDLTPLDLLENRDREQFVREDIPRLQDLPDAEPVTVRHKKRSGEIIDVSIRNHFVQFGDRTALMALLEDVTKRLRAERDLHNANERFLLATEAVNSVIYDWDVASGCSINTAGLIPLLGFDPLTDHGVDTIEWWNSRIHSDDKSSVLWAIDQALAEGSRFELEYRMRHKRGHYVYVWDRGVITRDEEGNATRVIGSTQEITARKRLEAQLLQERNHALDAKQSAEEMSLLKTNFLANMSHEIRTPMTAILGFSQILAEDLAGTPDARHASIIESSAQRLLGTINSILDLARVESRKVVLNPSEVDVNNEVERLVNLLEPLASQRNLNLYFERSAQPSMAFVDGHCLSQIVTNLIGNALKFTNEGHVAVRVHIGCETETPVPVVPGFASFSTAKHPRGEHFRIVVEDSGAGISPESLALVFDEFRQESTGYNRSFEGTGLGLTISGRLASAMGGSIEVCSAQGVGSTFIVRLPAGAPDNGTSSE
jgi:PAS domain S-box-containing protein